MADTIKHHVLTRSNLHTPKGVTTAKKEEIYVADGSGSGSWQKPGNGSATSYEGYAAAYIKDAEGGLSIDVDIPYSQGNDWIFYARLGDGSSPALVNEWGEDDSEYRFTVEGDPVSEPTILEYKTPMVGGNALSIAASFQLFTNSPFNVFKTAYLSPEVDVTLEGLLSPVRVNTSRNTYADTYVRIIAPRGYLVSKDGTSFGVYVEYEEEQVVLNSAGGGFAPQIPDALNGRFPNFVNADSWAFDAVGDQPLYVKEQSSGEVTSALVLSRIRLPYNVKYPDGTYRPLTSDEVVSFGIDTEENAFITGDQFTCNFDDPHNCPSPSDSIVSTWGSASVTNTITTDQTPLSPVVSVPDREDLFKKTLLEVWSLMRSNSYLFTGGSSSSNPGDPIFSVSSTGSASFDSSCSTPFSDASSHTATFYLRISSLPNGGSSMDFDDTFLDGLSVGDYADDVATSVMRAPTGQNAVFDIRQTRTVSDIFNNPPVTQTYTSNPYCGYLICSVPEGNPYCEGSLEEAYTLFQIGADNASIIKLEGALYYITYGTKAEYDEDEE